MRMARLPSRTGNRPCTSCSPWSPPRAFPAAGGHWGLPRPQDLEGKVSKFTFIDFLWPVWPNMWEGGDQEFLEAALTAAEMTAVAPMSGPI